MLVINFAIYRHGDNYTHSLWPGKLELSSEWLSESRMGSISARGTDTFVVDVLVLFFYFFKGVSLSLAVIATVLIS